MPGEKPPYNPEDEYNDDKELTPEEQAEEDKKREQRVDKMFAWGRARKEAEPKPLKKLREKFPSGLGMHHEGRVLPPAKIDKRDKSEVAEDDEMGAKKLNREVSNLIKDYKLEKVLNFKITVSDKSRDKYVLKLLENYRTVWQTEDKPENIPGRLEEYLKNR